MRSYTVKNYFWKTNDHPNLAGSIFGPGTIQISLLDWIKIHPWPDYYPSLADIYSSSLMLLDGWVTTTDYLHLKTNPSHLL